MFGVWLRARFDECTVSGFENVPNIKKIGNFRLVDAMKVTNSEQEKNYIRQMVKNGSVWKIDGNGIGGSF